MGESLAIRVKQHLPSPVIDAARPVVRGIVHVRHRSRQTIRASQRQVALRLKDFFLRYRLSRWGPTLFTLLARLRAPRDEHRRRLLAGRYRTAANTLVMSDIAGFVLFSPAQLPVLNHVLRTCDLLFRSKAGLSARIDQYGADRKRGFLRNLLTNEDLAARPELVELALSEPLLSAVSRYLGAIPHLNRIDLLYSVPRSGEGLEASQLFHLDPEGLTQAKVFVNVYDVDVAFGPFSFIPADESRRLVEGISSRRTRARLPVVGRYTDEEIAELGGSSAILRVIGPAGTGVIVDTSRCLHSGSRVRPGSFRVCLYIQYCTSREQGNVFDVGRFAHDPIRLLAVEQSLRSAGTKVAAPHQVRGTIAYRLSLAAGAGTTTTPSTISRLRAAG